MKHDYNLMLKGMPKYENYSSGEVYLREVEMWYSHHMEGISHALSLADKLTGEPSRMMIEEGKRNLWEKDIFKAMVAQAELELEKK